SPGDYTATLTVSDGRGGTALPTTSVHIVQPPAMLQTLSLGPLGLRFSTVGAGQGLAVTGHYSDNSTRDLTASTSGTLYSSDNPFVANVSADGVVSAVGNGAATITAINRAVTAN